MYRFNKKIDFVRFLFGGLFILSIGIIAMILVFLLFTGYPAFSRNGIYFFTGTTWRPGTKYGALPMIYGTLAVTLLAIVVSLPIGLGTAIVTSEMLTFKPRLVVKSVLELLAGIPGVVYGLIGIALFTTMVRDLFGLLDGNTLFTAGLLLSIMILPLIITLSDDALRNVPKEYREQALALGLNKCETILYAVLPAAGKGILGGVLLAVSRAMGETIAVMLVVGSIDRLPTPFYNIFAPSQTITSKLGREAAEAVGTPGHWNALMALGLVLFILVMVLTFTGEMIGTSDNKNKSKNMIESK